MATDYFTMMRDVVGSYGEGLDLARSRARFDAEEARKATKFNQEQEQYERTRGIQRDTDAAFGTYKALQDGVYDGTKADFSGLPQGIDAGPVRDVAPVTGLGGGAVPKRAATRLENLGALRGVALASKDAAGLGRLDEQYHVAAFEDAFGKNVKGYTGAPEQIRETAQHINVNSKSLTMGTTDKQGFIPVSVVTPDREAVFIKLSKQEQAQVYAAGQLLDQYPMKALEILKGVNKDLAAAVAAENGIVDKVGQHQNTMAYQKGQLAEAQQRTAVARAGLGSRQEQAQPVGLSDDGKRILARQGNKLVEMPVPDGYSKLFPRLTGDRPARPEFTPKDIADVVTELRMDKANKGLSYEALRDKAVGILGGGQQGGIPGWGEATAPATAEKPSPKEKPSAIKPAPSRQQAAYDAWMASKPAWYEQETPTSRARQAAAEQEYLDALRNPPR